MKQRFLSIFIAVTLMASVIAGAMSVSLRPAKAGAGEDIYSDDLRSYFLDLAPSQSTDINAFFDKVDDALEEGSQKCVFAGEKNGYWIINIYNLPAGTDVYSYADFYGNSGISKSTGWANVNFLREAYFAYNGSVTYAPTSDQFYALMGEGFNYSNPAYWSYYFVPNIFDYQSANVYSSIDILPNGGFSFSANFFGGTSEPDYILFDVVVFYVGERKYFTFLQQEIFRDLMPDHMDYMVSFYADSSDEVISFTWDDVTLLPYAQNYINQPFENVSPAGIYAVDISMYDWVVLDLINLVGFDGDLNAYFAGYAVNSPYRIPNEPGTEGTSDSYTQVFNTFYEYANNYNRTHYIPENLGDTLFGLNGSRLYPCEVSVPVAVWNANTSGGSSFADSHNWKWWFPSRDNYGINFELMDVVIVTEPYNDRYSLLYYYSDSLNVPFQFIQNMTFDELLEEFDCIIIVPDDLNCLDGNVWWKNLLSDICTFLGISNLASDLLTSLAMSGSDSNGVEYVTSRPDEVPGTLQGFCIVTKKALQRQQLYVFNEGITKTYELMSNYLDERGKWEDSFFEWTLSLFYQWQTLYGYLDDIYNLLFNWSSLFEDISQKLDQIAENTSEDDPGFWFISFYNWVKRWEPSNLDFANWVDSWDDFTDDLPDPGSGVTVIPLPTSIPTAALAGG